MIRYRIHCQNRCWFNLTQVRYIYATLVVNLFYRYRCLQIMIRVHIFSILHVYHFCCS